MPNKANKFLFIFGSIFVLFLSFLGWVAIPFDIYTQILNLNYSLLYILVISSLGVYGILLAGWSSNSKYAMLGALRSVSQMISYEVAISLCIIPICMFCGSLDMNKIVYMQIKTVWFVFPMLPAAIIFFISILAETNRAPFDLAEAEAELVAGYNVEYSGITFAAFFLGEYSNILFMSGLFVCFFLGGGDTGRSFDFFSNSSVLQQNLVFSLKLVFTAAVFIFVRANLPRFRFDQLMYIG
jgi:NADH-quinone oxidoreductase subunit H